MEIVTGTIYYIKVRYPWGEVKRFECDKVSRMEDGSVTWLSETSVGLEPCVDNVIEENDRFLCGWLGGTCDTTATIALTPDEGPDL